MSDMSSTEAQAGSAPAASPALPGRRPQPLRIAVGVGIPFPAAATPTRTRHSDHVFAGLRAPPSPPGTARWAPSFSLSPTPHRTHFDSFSSVVEIPRFGKRELNLGIVRGAAQGAAWFALWAGWVANGLATAFFDVNIMYMLAQSAVHLSSALWIFLAAAYAACWAASVGVWLIYGVGFHFYRRWRRVRPAIEPIYLSLYANLHLSLLSFDHFCFLLHIRLSPWRTRHALDIVPETCYAVVQLLPGLVPMTVRAGIASVLLISNWDTGATKGLAGTERDPRFFVPSGLTPYARGVVLASCGYVIFRIIAVALAGATLLLFLARPLRATNSREALLGRRDPAAVHFPATTWRDENELQWAWRARTRARVQDAFELCMVRPTRSSVTLEKTVLPPARAHRRGDSVLPRVLSHDFARRDDEPVSPNPAQIGSEHTPTTQSSLPGAVIESRRRKKESTAPLTFADTFGGMMADGFYGDVVELGSYDLSPTTLIREIHASVGLSRVSEESEPGSAPKQSDPSSASSSDARPKNQSPRWDSPLETDVPASSRSLASWPTTSPLTPTFVPMSTYIPMGPMPAASPHPLDAATGEPTLTASKGPVSFEVWRGRQPSSRHVSFGSRLSGFSAEATHGTIDPDDSYEELMSWSTDGEAVERHAWSPRHGHDVEERPPRGSAFFGDAPSRESLACSALLDTSRASTLLDTSMIADASGMTSVFALDDSGDTSVSLDPTRVSTTFGLNVLHPVLTELQPATPPKVSHGPSTPPRPVAPLQRPPLEPLEPRTPACQPSEPSMYSVPSSGDDTISETDLFYQRKRRGSTAAVGLRTTAVPMSPEFGSIPSPPGSPLHASLPLGSPLDSPLRLPLRARNLSAPSGEIDDFGSGVGGESTPKPRRESPSRRLSFTSDVEWLGNGSPSSSPSKSSNRVVVVSPPPLLELEGVPAQPAISLPPVVPPSAPIASPPTAVPAPSAPPPPRSDNSNNAEFPSGSLRKRRVPAPLLNIPPPPSAFPTPPPVPVSGDIPPPLPSSFSRGYRSRIVRGAVPWRDGKID